MSDVTQTSWSTSVLKDVRKGSQTRKRMRSKVAFLFHRHSRRCVWVAWRNWCLFFAILRRSFEDLPNDQQRSFYSSLTRFRHFFSASRSDSSTWRTQDTATGSLIDYNVRDSRVYPENRGVNDSFALVWLQSQQSESISKMDMMSFCLFILLKVDCSLISRFDWITDVASVTKWRVKRNLVRNLRIKYLSLRFEDDSPCVRVEERPVFATKNLAEFVTTCCCQGKTCPRNSSNIHGLFSSWRQIPFNQKRQEQE